MYFPHPGGERPLLVFVLAVVGVLLRFAFPNRIGGFGLRRFRTAPDEDIFLKVRARAGELILVWAAWVLIQILVGMKASWINAFWVPLSLVTLIIPSYMASLYARRYLGEGEGYAPARAWLWIGLREAVPLGIILLTILAVRNVHPSLPDQVPTGWDPGTRDLIWTGRDAALRILRHRTMIAYAVLFGSEGAYLLLRWGRAHEDLARRMLSRPHWLFFWFRSAWVLLFAGMNLGFVDAALEGGSPLPYLLPGLAALSGFGLSVTLSRGKDTPPPRRP
jgi:hypothetical protein